MSNQLRPLPTLQLLLLSVALLILCGSLKTVFGQLISGLDTKVSTPNRLPNPSTKASHGSGKGSANRSEASTKGEPLPAEVRLDETQREIEQTIEQGNKARDKNDYERAIAKYRKVADELNPKDARAYYGLGNVYAELLCSDLAIRAYLDSLQLNNDYLDARVGLGWVYISKDRYDDAWKQFQEAAPRNVSARIGLGMVYAKQGKYLQAIEQVNLVINDKTIPDLDRAVGYVVLGDVYVTWNKWPEAIAPYESAISLNPKSAIAYIKLGMAQLASAFTKFGNLASQEVRMQDMEKLVAAAREAGQNIQKAVERDYNHPIGQLILGQALIYQSNYRGAVAKFNTYLSSVKEFENRWPTIAARCDYGFGTLKASGHWYLGFVHVRESTVETDNQRKNELLDEAIRQFKESIKLKEDFAAAYGMLANVYSQRKDFEAAIEQFKKELIHETRDSDKASTNASIGFACYMIGRYSEAAGYLNKAIALDPKLPGPYATFSRIYQAQGNLDEAIVQQKKAMALEPEPTALSYHSLGGLYFSKARQNSNESDYLEAIRLLKKGIEINPDYVLSYLALGNVYKFYKSGAMADEALANYKKAAEYQPKNALIYFHIGDLYSAILHNNEAAIENLQLAIKLKPDFAAAYWELGLIYHEKHDDAEAIKYLLEAIKYDPKQLNAHLTLAEIYKAQKDYPEAIKYLNKLTAIVPTEFYAFKELAKIYEKQGKKEDAIRYYLEAMNRLKPNDLFGKGLYECRMERLRGHYSEAIGCFHRLKPSPSEDPGQQAYDIGLTYVASKNKKAALAQYEQLKLLKSSLAEDLLSQIHEMK